MIDLIPCPEQPCDAPCEVLERYVMESTDGPVEMMRTRCLQGHYLNCPVWVNSHA